MIQQDVAKLMCISLQHRSSLLHLAPDDAVLADVCNVFVTCMAHEFDNDLQDHGNIARLNSAV